jgi:hypothetical protein
MKVGSELVPYSQLALGEYFSFFDDLAVCAVGLCQKLSTGEYVCLGDVSLDGKTLKKDVKKLFSFDPIVVRYKIVAEAEDGAAA